MAWVHELIKGDPREPESTAGQPTYAVGEAASGEAFLLVMTYPEGRGPTPTGAGSKQQLHFSRTGVAELEKAIAEFKTRFGA